MMTHIQFSAYLFSVICAARFLLIAKCVLYVLVIIAMLVIVYILLIAGRLAIESAKIGRKVLNEIDKEYYGEKKETTIQ